MLIPPPPKSTLFPYTTLFRSERVRERRRSGCRRQCGARNRPDGLEVSVQLQREHGHDGYRVRGESAAGDAHPDFPQRSEEHTSELQSRLHLVCRLLLEKKNSK